MQNSTKLLIKQYSKKNKHQRAWKKVVQTLACIVVFCTTYALILPAITMERPTLCGQEEHQHNINCYAKLTSETEKELSCTYETLDVHVHTENCFDEENMPICQLADFLVHTHSELCFDKNGELRCQLPAILEHEHDESCYENPHQHDESCYELQQGDLLCSMIEGEGHTHSEECSAEAILICGMEEMEGHQHSEACQSNILICENADSEHKHNETCYEQSVCEIPEIEGHVHVEGCYSEEKVCDLEEMEAHSHSDECYEKIEVLICDIPNSIPDVEMEELDQLEPLCGQQEIILHSHEEDCYEVYQDANGSEQKKLICQKTVILEHVHGDTCCALEEPIENEDTLTCVQKENEDHVHNELCYGMWELVCSLMEHSHSDECYTKENPIYICGKEEHTHDEACRNEQNNMICCQEEHSHDETCIKETINSGLSSLTGDEAYLAELKYINLDLVSNETNSIDSEESELVKVKSQDTILYQFAFKTLSYTEATYDSGRVKIEIVLPLTEEQAVFDLEQMSWIDQTEGYTPVLRNEERVYHEEAVDCQILTAYYQLLPQENQMHAVPCESFLDVAVKVLNLSKDNFVSILLSAAMEHSTWEGMCPQHLIEEKLTVASEIVEVSNELSLEEQQKKYEEYLLQLESLEMAHSESETVLAEAEELQKLLRESFEKGELSEEMFSELQDRLLVTLKDYYQSIAEAAIGTNWMKLRDSGWFEEYSDYSRVSRKAMLKTAAATTPATQSLSDEPSDEQVDKEGGSNSSEEDKVTVSKTIDGTDLENVFDITLTVETQQKITEIINEPDMAVVIVMDISNTMNSDFGDTSRYEAAMDSAEAFLDKFADATGDISKIGYVAFNTDAHEIFGLSSCSTEEQIAGLKNTMRTVTGNIINASGYADSHSRFTNVEAGLLRGYDMIKDAPNKNKYIIFLSDGFPTTYVSSGYNGYDPYTSSGTIGDDGVFYDYVTEYYCSYGTSYSDKAAIKARQQAAAIKNAGVNIFSIGVDVGGQTIEGYDGREGLSVIDRTDTTYEIGDAKSTEAYKNWLKNSIGSGYYYDSTDAAGLEQAYDEIFEEIKSMNASASQADWVAEDPIPSVDGVPYVEFIGFFDKEGTLVKTDLSGSSNEGAEDTAVFKDSEISWDLKESGYMKVESGDTTKYSYQLVYRVRLKNEVAGFVERQSYDTNDTTTLQYKITETVNGTTVMSESRTLEFPIPAVHGYLAEFSFDKIDSLNRVVNGAEFTLTHDTTTCSVCRGDGTTVSAVSTQVAVSGADGKVTFTNIPSGHLYTLEETKVPDGYHATTNKYRVTVAYDTINVTVTSIDGTEIAWDSEIVNYTSYELPQTGGTGTKLYTAGGLLFLAAGALLYIHIKRRREEQITS